MSGTWVIVCGPSGVGKDSVLAWARAALAPHRRICFARRLVTRAAGPDAEHEEVSPSLLQSLRSSGGLAWHWEAHGLGYGVRAGYRERVAAGDVVVVNGSRAHASEVADRPDVRCLLLSADEALLRERLRARGREDAAQLAERLARNTRLPQPPAHRVIRNDSDVAAAGAALRDYLLELAP